MAKLAGCIIKESKYAFMIKLTVGGEMVRIFFANQMQVFLKNVSTKSLTHSTLSTRLIRITLK